MRKSAPFVDWAKTVTLPDGSLLTDIRNKGVQAKIFLCLAGLAELDQDALFVQALQVKADLKKFAAMVALKYLDANPIFALIKQLEELAEKPKDEGEPVVTQPALPVTSVARPLPPVVGSKLVVNPITQEEAAPASSPVNSDERPRVIIRNPESQADPGQGGGNLAPDAAGNQQVITVPPPPSPVLKRTTPSASKGGQPTGLSAWLKTKTDAFNDWREGLGSGRPSVGRSSSSRAGQDKSSGYGTKIAFIALAVLILLISAGVLWRLGNENGQYTNSNQSTAVDLGLPACVTADGVSGVTRYTITPNLDIVGLSGFVDPQRTHCTQIPPWFLNKGSRIRL